MLINVTTIYFLFVGLVIAENQQDQTAGLAVVPKSVPGMSEPDFINTQAIIARWVLQLHHLRIIHFREFEGSLYGPDTTVTVMSVYIAVPVAVGVLSLVGQFD